MDTMRWVACGRNSSHSLKRSFLNFAGVFDMVWRCTCGLGIIFPFFLFLFFSLCPPPPPAYGVYSFSPWCYIRTCVSTYVTFVTRFKFTCKFRCKFTPAFLLQLITFIPSGLESWNFVWHLPTSRPFNVWYRWPRVMPLGGARVGTGASVYFGQVSSFFLLLLLFVFFILFSLLWLNLFQARLPLE